MSFTKRPRILGNLENLKLVPKSNARWPYILVLFDRPFMVKYEILCRFELSIENHAIIFVAFLEVAFIKVNLAFLLYKK